LVDQGGEKANDAIAGKPGPRSNREPNQKSVIVPWNDLLPFNEKSGHAQTGEEQGQVDGIHQEPIQCPVQAGSDVCWAMEEWE